MFPPPQPWTCGRCQNVNAARAMHCARCGWSPMTEPTVMDPPRGSRRLGNQQLAVFAAVLVIGFVLLLIGGRAVLRWDPDAAPIAVPANGPLHVHSSEILRYDMGAGQIVLRCPQCNGTGIRRVGLAQKPEVCEFCNGLGRQTVLVSHGVTIDP